MAKTVEITAFVSARHAYVDPPILQIDAGETVEFVWRRPIEGAQVWFADGEVFTPGSSGQEWNPRVPISIRNGRQSVKVAKQPAAERQTAGEPSSAAAKDVQILEYVVLVELPGNKRVFAVGASTPKIVIRPTT